MGNQRKDLFLAKRRVLAILPFIIINFCISIILLVFSIIIKYRLNIINTKYLSSNYDYHNCIVNNNNECKIYDDNISKNKNFSEVFKIESNSYKLEDNIKNFFHNLIISTSYFSLLLIIISILYKRYVKPYFDIKKNPFNKPNKKHFITLMFIIFKCCLSLHLYIVFIIEFLNTFKLYNLNIFENVDFFYNTCTSKNEDFKSNYSYIWNYKIFLILFFIFLAAFFLFDIIGIVFSFLAYCYNVWTLILSLITCGKYLYIPVECIIDTDLLDSEDDLLNFE